MRLVRSRTDGKLGPWLGRRALAGLGVLLIVLSVAGAQPPTVGRGEPNLPTTDIVLLIDQSGSTAQSDPNNQRIEAARQVVDTVAAYSDAFPVRVGAVSFGSPRFPRSLRIDKALTPADSAGLRDVFQVGRVAGTDFDSALCLSWSVATQQPAPAGCPVEVPAESVRAEPRAVRSRVVVLLTDGFPAPDGVDLEFPGGEPLSACTSGSSGHLYMCRLRDRWRALTAQTPVSLYVIGIDRSANQWFPKTEAYWRVITGCEGDTACRRAVRSTPDPVSLVKDMLFAATGDLIDLCAVSGLASECKLPPSLAEAQFVIRGLQPQDKVRVVSPAGREVQAGISAKVTTAGGAERWRVRAPTKGTWRVESSNPAAQLSVSQVLVPQRFELQPVPEQPGVGGAVTFELRPEGELLVDVPSLQSEIFELRLQVEGGSERRYPVRLVDRPSGVLRTEPPVTVTPAGRWSAALLLPVNADALLLGRTSFVVSVVPPTPTITPTASPTPRTAETPPTPTLGPQCHITIEPNGAAAPRYRSAFSLGYPLRFSEKQEFSARVDGEGCPGEQINLLLQIEPDDGSTGPCAVLNECEWRGRGRPPVTVRAVPSDETLRAASLRRFAAASDQTDWTLEREDSVELMTPPWIELEHRSFVGYWLPVVMLLALLYSVSWASTRQMVAVSQPPNSRAPLRDAAVMDQRSQPLVRLGALVWRRFQKNNVIGAITLRFLVAGPPVGRVWADGAPAPRRQPFGERFSAWSALLRRFAAGKPLDQLGLSVIRVNRR